jgi:hypothetical protein
MTEKITESAIEKFAIELLEKSGYHYVYGRNCSEIPESSNCITRAFSKYTFGMLLNLSIQAAEDSSVA